MAFRTGPALRQLEPGKSVSMCEFFSCHQTEQSSAASRSGPVEEGLSVERLNPVILSWGCLG